MKKVIIFILLIQTMSSCSQDNFDSTTQSEIFEEFWTWVNL